MKKQAAHVIGAAGVVRVKVLALGFFPSAIATAPVKPVATFPKASSARTFTAGVIWWSATVVLGCVPNTSWVAAPGVMVKPRSEEHTSELQSRLHLVCRLLLEKKKKDPNPHCNRLTHYAQSCHT